MWFFSKQQPKENPAQERLATFIACRIVRWQRAAANRLNGHARRYEKAAQLRWFWLFCLLAAAAIVCSVLLTSRKGTLPHIRSSILPAHIGQSSDGVPKKTAISSDSLTHKNKTHGNEH